MLNFLQKVLKIETGCTDKEASETAKAICKSPETVAKLAVACGVSTAAVGLGGYLAVAGMGAAPVSAGTTLAVTGAGLVIGAKGAKGVKKFCTAMVKHGSDINSDAIIRLYSNYIGN
ncbi:hypothetical protein GCM10023188_36330 [Pontibacter saemangeumensis]|uniref:Uncharacterized protein n=1 Tax=Pontibacter saemangeumensis TaxID=1084525 RepID=A0ABP8LYX3_9BACT